MQLGTVFQTAEDAQVCPGKMFLPFTAFAAPEMTFRAAGQWFETICIPYGLCFLLSDRPVQIIGKRLNFGNRVFYQVLVMCNKETPFIF